MFSFILMLSVGLMAIRFQPLPKLIDVRIDQSCHAAFAIFRSLFFF